METLGILHPVGIFLSANELLDLRYTSHFCYTNLKRLWETVQVWHDIAWEVHGCIQHVRELVVYNNRTLLHLPNQLRTLHIPSIDFFGPSIYPSTLTVLSFDCIVWRTSATLPQSLKRLYFKDFRSARLPILPSSLELLHAENADNLQIEPGDIPPSLRTLMLSSSKNEPIFETGTALNAISTLHTNGRLSRATATSWPKTLTHLHLEPHVEPYCLQVLVPSLVFLPRSLTMLHLGGEFNERIRRGVLPQSLTTLIFGDKFTKPISKGTLPDSITHLEFGPTYCESLDTIPIDLKRLQFRVGLDSYLIGKPWEKLVEVRYVKKPEQIHIPHTSIRYACNCHP
jgi:hypothetical protein